MRPVRRPPDARLCRKEAGNLKLLICDDDISTINVIESQLDWQAMGIHTILKAFNGLIAIQIIQQEKPELVLCDIGMPLCNGIKVLKYISDNGIKTKFAFLTCYESFEFAREAIQYGAVDYLTKPLDLDNIAGSLKKMALEAQAEKASVLQAAEWNKNRNDVTSAYLRSICEGLYGSEPDQLDGKLELEGIPLRAMQSFWQVRICINPENIPDNTAQGKAFLQEYRALCQEFLGRQDDFKLMFAEGGGIYYILNVFISEESCSEQGLNQQCRGLIDACTKKYQISPACLIVPPAPLYRITQMHAMLRRQVQKLRLSSGQVVSLKAMESVDMAGPCYRFDHDAMMMLITKGDAKSFKASVSSALQAITQSCDFLVRDQQMALLHHDLLQCLYRVLFDNNVTSYCLAQNREFWEMDFAAERSARDLMGFAQCLFVLAVETIQNKDSQSCAIQTARKYIEANYRRNISREEIAASVFISPNYLSRRFRGETGTGIREYINQLRIIEAKRLLMNAGKSVGAVAEEVGFESVSYFSTVFHKQCGLGPHEWRGRAIQEANAGSLK